MPNYQDGKIYTIRNYADNEMVYVGSTTQTLSRRLAKHRTDCKGRSCITLYSHIVDNDWSNWYIELYEYYPCNNRTELEKREGEVIREIGTINKRIAGRTMKEWREDNVEKLKEKNKKNYEENPEYFKEYREENVEKIKEQWKKYYEDNAEKIKEKNKKYREDNADKIKEYKKTYYEDNAEKNKEKICCDICGAFSSKNHLVRHQKTKKCTDIKSKNYFLCV